MKSLCQFIIESQQLSLDEIWDIFASITPEDYAKKKQIKGTKNVYKSIINLQHRGILENELKSADAADIQASGKAFLVIGGSTQPHNCWIVKANVEYQIENPFIIIKNDKDIYAKEHSLKDNTFKRGDWVIYEIPKDIEEKIFSFLK